MKKTILGLFAFVCAFSGVSCSEDDLSGTSVIKPEQTTETPLDAWLYKNYIEPYNIEFRYRYEDMESDMIYDLTPANYEKSVQMAKLVKHLCLQAYDEVTGSRDFITSYFPKMVFLVGSPAYNNNGEVVLGTAEGGTKITLYAVNNMDPTNVDLLNEWYFKTIHHEFGHILNQTKPYPTDFAEISGPDYVQDQCFEIYKTTESALQKGFISPYASKADGEDFVELIALYVNRSAEEWEEMLTTAGDTGRPKIEAKFEIVSNYMKSTWNIDLNELREIVLRRAEEAPNLDFDSLDDEDTDTPENSGTNE